MKKTTGEGKAFTALLTNLSKAHDCLPHDLTLTKLNVYGISLDSLRLTICHIENIDQE